MTIKNRLLLLMGIIVTLSLGLLGWQYYAAQRADLLRKGLVTLMDVEADMQALYALEQNFLLNHKDQTRLDFHAEVKSLERELHELDEILMALGLNTALVGKIVKNLAMLEADFDSLAGLSQFIGLHQDMGLRGSLRNAAHQVEDAFRELGNHELLAHLLMLRRHEKDFLLRLDEKYGLKFNQSYAELLIALEKHEPDNPLLDTTWHNLNAYAELFQLLVSYKRQMGLTDRSGLRGKLATHINQTIENQKMLMQTTTSAIEKARDIQKTISLASMLAMIGILIAASLIISRAISQKLKRVTQAMEQIAEGNADLKTMLPEEGHDETAQIAKAFNKFTRKLDHTVQQILMIAGNLSQGSLRAQEITQATSSAIEEQVDAITQLNDKIGQMASSSQQVKSAIGDASETVREVQRKAAEGRTVVDNAVRGMQEMQSEITCLEQSIASLTGHHENVGRILDMIVTIAEQTNLLALNAAIEAARAGEYGRGFAVVADEVRALSQRTTEATDEVRVLMETIRAGNQEAVDLMTRSAKASAHNLERTQAAGETFALIASAVDDINERNITISSLAEQQSALANEVYENIQQIHDTVHDLSELARKNISDNGDLSQFSVQLEFLVAGFSGEGGGPPHSPTGQASIPSEDKVELF